MNRIILSALNAPVLVLLLLVGFAVQSSFFGSALLTWLKPDLLLLAVVWFGLRRSLIEGGILTLILSVFMESHSSSPQGVLMVAYMVAYLTIRFGSRLIVLPNRNSLALMAAGTVVIHRLAIMGVLAVMGLSDGHWNHLLLRLAPSIVVNALLSLAVFQFLERFDWATYKTARARQVLEDEHNIEQQGY